MDCQRGADAQFQCALVEHGQRPGQSEGQTGHVLEFWRGRRSESSRRRRPSSQVLSCTWTSRPMTGSYAAITSGEMLGASWVSFAIRVASIPFDAHGRMRVSFDRNRAQRVSPLTGLSRFFLPFSHPDQVGVGYVLSSLRDSSPAPVCLYRFRRGHFRHTLQRHFSATSVKWIVDRRARGQLSQTGNKTEIGCKDSHSSFRESGKPTEELFMRSLLRTRNSRVSELSVPSFQHHRLPRLA